MRRYDDLVIGEKFTSDFLTVDGAEMLAFSREYDPQWFHADEEKSRQSPFGEVIASGVYVLVLYGANSTIKFGILIIFAVLNGQAPNG